MMFNSIVWPKDGVEARKLYLTFLIDVLKMKNVKFSSDNHNPMKVTQDLIDELISEETYQSSADYWWSIIDDNNLLRDFESNVALNARLALCLLGVKADDGENLGEHLSWFFQMLKKLKFETDSVEEYATGYFNS